MYFLPLFFDMIVLFIGNVVVVYLIVVRYWPDFLLHPTLTRMYLV